MKRSLGDFPLDPHFIPNYDPWDQRLCLAPDGDFFKVLREGKADVVTDHIDRFTENGILLRSGRELEADIIITATGLNLLAFGGMSLTIDEEEVDLSKKYTYKGMMLNDVPNAIFFIGYTNASWTLKSDLTSEYTSRLMAHMEKKGYDYFVAGIDPEDAGDVPVMDLQSGYVQRSLHLMPKQGKRIPWKLYQNYFLDFFTLRLRPVEDDALEFKRISRAVSKRSGLRQRRSSVRSIF
jgi:cation diffusion facilitator CzcD-associated flavoprotein CzcO